MLPETPSRLIQPPRSLDAIAQDLRAVVYDSNDGALSKESLERTRDAQQQRRERMEAVIRSCPAEKDQLQIRAAYAALDYLEQPSELTDLMDIRLPRAAYGLQQTHRPEHHDFVQSIAPLRIDLVYNNELRTICAINLAEIRTSQTLVQQLSDAGALNPALAQEVDQELQRGRQHYAAILPLLDEVKHALPYYSNFITKIICEAERNSPQK